MAERRIPSGRPRGPQLSDSCFLCGQTVHWVRECSQSQPAWPFHQEPNQQASPSPYPQGPVGPGYQIQWHTLQNNLSAWEWADLILNLQVMNNTLPFLVDTRATYSTLNRHLSDYKLSTQSVEVICFSGGKTKTASDTFYDNSGWNTIPCISFCDIQLSTCKSTRKRYYLN